MLGDTTVGKASIIESYCNKKFDEKVLTRIGLDFITNKFNYKDEEFVVKIWDQAGQERFKTLTYGFYKVANGIILIYEQADAKTFDLIKNWLDSIKEHADNLPIIVLGNKQGPET